MMSLLDEKADEFYEVHKNCPFMVNWMPLWRRGLVMFQLLEGNELIAINREVIGATNPAEIAAGTIGSDFASSID